MKIKFKLYENAKKTFEEEKNWSNFLILKITALDILNHYIEYDSCFYEKLADSKYTDELFEIARTYYDEKEKKLKPYF